MSLLFKPKNQKNELPPDVISYATKKFNNKDSKIVVEFLQQKYNEIINVGKDQYVRSILYLIDDNIDNIKKYNIVEDPRDFVSAANDKAKNKFNFFINPLD